MANDSSTGGPLAPLPAPAPAPLENQALNRFLQQWVVGITGMDGTLVRPRYQGEPPNIPPTAQAWAAVGVGPRKTDQYPYVIHDGDGQGSDKMQRHETMELICSFYDLGTDGMADYYASLLRDGALIAQNQEVLENNHFKLIGMGEMTPLPSLLKLRWLYRVDLTVELRRQIDRTYPVLNLESMDGTLETDEGLIEPLVVTED